MVVEGEKQRDRSEITGGDRKRKNRRTDNMVGRGKQKTKLTEKTGKGRNKEKMREK